MFCNHLTSIRKMMGLTQVVLGRRCGISGAHISQYESGKRDPSFANLKKIKAGTGFSYDKLIDGI